MKQSDYMKYADIIYNGQKYRAVVFTSYRPYLTMGSSSSYYYQSSNGYAVNKIYWFRYESLKWRVLDGGTGLAICETIIDSQPFTNTMYWGADGEHYKDPACTVYCNNYAESDIRDWLNDEFYNTAFTSSEKNTVRYTTLDNRATIDGYSEYDSESTTDKIFLLSYSEVLYSNLFPDDASRRAQGSDYAKCQGLYAAPNKWSSWFLRSASDDSDIARIVYDNGAVYNGDVTYCTHYGVRPALRLNLQSVNVEVAEEKVYSESVTIADESVNYTFGNCIPDEKYVLMSIADYSEGFTLTEENLQFIDEVKADENGTVSGSFLPKSSDANGTTLLFGNFKVCEIAITNAPTEADYKTSFRLSAQLINGTGDEKVTWSSSNEKILKVDANGNVSAVGRGTATITATVDGTDISDSVTVTVKYTWWQWILVIILFGWIWY